MKRLFIILALFAFLLSSCKTNAFEGKKQEELEYIPTKTEESTEDKWGERISKNRKKVFEMIEENPDALSYVPKPAEREPVQMEPIDDIPNCVVEWAYHYFNHRVTYEFPEYFSGYGEIERVLRVLTGIRRVENEPVDTLTITAHLNQFNINDSDMRTSLSVTFMCHYEVYNEEKQKYVATETDNIRVFFSLISEGEEWIIEDVDIDGGEYYDYAVICMYKTMGRFPDISEYEIADYTIYEYAEKLYSFGTPSPIP